MLITIKDQKKEFNNHIDKLVAQCPGKTKIELFNEFFAENGFNNKYNENYFYDFTLAFEAFLYFKYNVYKHLKYFDIERFYI